VIAAVVWVNLPMRRGGSLAGARGSE